MKLDITAVSVSIGPVTILRDADMTVAPGDVVGLVGPNGSGKTTLLRTVYRSLRPDTGTVRIGDDDVWALSARSAAQRTAAVLQSGQTPGGLTVTEAVTLGRTPHHGLLDRESAQDREVVLEALKRTGMLSYADRYYATLSGGERQRVLLARALAQEPRLLVLDEPTNHLDIRARFDLLALIRATGITTLAVLHDLDLAARSCDQIVVLHDGQIAAAGSVLDVLTPTILRDVFGVNATAERHEDDIIRINYHANPFA